jgi:hypothetical protein
MASAQINGVLKFYRIKSNNTKEFLYGGDIKALGPSGSSDGTIASTPEKWVYIPLQSATDKILRVNEKLLVTFTAASAATTDASDSAWAIPITYGDGSSDTLGGPSDSTVWDSFVLGDVALIAGREYPVCEKRVTQPFALGSNTQKAFASIENNA